MIYDPLLGTTAMKQLTNCYPIVECGPNRTRSLSVSWNASGNYLGIATSDSTVRIWTIDATATATATATTTAAVAAASGPQQQSTSTSSTAGVGTSSGSSSAKEVLTFTGHSAPVAIVNFHPTSDSTVVSSSTDHTILLWDVRNTTQQKYNIIGKISSSTTTTNDTNNNTSSSSSAKSGVPPPTVVSIQWHPIQSNLLAVTTRDGTVSVYDMRKLTTSLSSATTTTNSTTSGTTTASSSAATSARISTTSLSPDTVETCIFHPSGNYLLAGTTTAQTSPYDNKNNTQNYSGGMGYVKVWNWNDEHSSGSGTNNQSQQQENMVENSASSTLPPGSATAKNNKYFSYPAHAGPIYAMAISRSLLVTGGADAVVGIWNVATMTCCTTITSRTKFIRSVAISPDEQVVAIATEEDKLEFVDPSSATTVSSSPSSMFNGHKRGGSGSASTSIGVANLGQRPRSGGAEDVTFHPTCNSGYVLACARTDAGNSPPVTVMKLTISQ